MWQNILIASKSPIRIKLADFAASKSTIDTGLRTIVGTSGYMAPELLGMLPRTRRTREIYTNAVDLWSLGCVLYVALTLEMPFCLDPSNSSTESLSLDPASTDSRSLDSGVPYRIDMYLFYEFCSDRYPFPIGALHRHQVSTGGIDFIQRLLAADPRHRISAIDALESRWIRTPLYISRCELPTEFSRGYVVHTMKNETSTWTEGEWIGGGTFGSVHLAKQIVAGGAVTGQLRAVKKLSRGHCKKYKIDVTRELSAMIEVRNVSLVSILSLLMILKLMVAG